MKQFDFNDICGNVAAEIERQDTKWGDQRDLPSPIWITILLEEVGEVAKEVLENNNENARTELIQCASLCFQMIDAIDAGKFKRERSLLLKD